MPLALLPDGTAHLLSHHTISWKWQRCSDEYFPRHCWWDSIHGIHFSSWGSSRWVDDLGNRNHLLGAKAKSLCFLSLCMNWKQLLLHIVWMLQVHGNYSFGEEDALSPLSPFHWQLASFTAVLTSIQQICLCLWVCYGEDTHWYLKDIAALFTGCDPETK